MTDLVSYWSFFWFVLPFEARRLQRREEELAFAFCFLFFPFFSFFSDERLVRVDGAAGNSLNTLFFVCVCVCNE